MSQIAYHDEEIPPGYRIERVSQGKSLRLRVVFPDGTTTGAVSSADIAVRKIDAHRAKALEKERSCLCCGETFTSAGPGHRMCVRCRDSQREWNGC